MATLHFRPTQQSLVCPVASACGKPKPNKMKSLLPVAAVFCFTLSVHAAPESVPADPPKKVAEVVGGASGGLIDSSGTPTEADKPVKPMPMYRKVGGIDPSALTITYTTKKGVKMVEKVTDRTIIMQGDKPARFSDIKVGDMVSGLHLKTKENEFEILKITKFGPLEPKIKKTAESEKEAGKN